MESKSGSRTIKKSGSGGVLDRKKSRAKKKRDKRKPCVKGTESTDVPSPELDSEVQHDGDVTLTDQDGQTTPAGQVTRLPHLSSKSSISLTTQTPPPVTATSRRKSLLGGQPSSSSAPITRSASLAATQVTTPSANQLDGVVARMASLNIKQRTSKSRSKAQNSKSSSKSSRIKDRNNSNNGGQIVGSSSTTSKTISQTSLTLSESLRWELVLEDVEQERERLAAYKMNRRKRYLAAAQAKGLGWAMNYNSQTNVSPLSEDSGVDTVYGSLPNTTMASGKYIDFSSMQTLRPIPAHRGLQEAFVEC